MRFERYDYHLPEFWAPAIINDDRTGMEDEEIEQMERWFARRSEELGEGHWALETDPETGEFAEASFMRYHDATDVMPLACDCLPFVWMKRVPDALPEKAS